MLGAACVIAGRCGQVSDAMQLVIFGLVVLAASVLVMMIKKAICKKSLAANPDK